MPFPRVDFGLPAWADGFVREQASAYPDAESRLRLAIKLADRNVREGTGGPFGAAVFERDSGRLVSVGVNLVVPSNCSLAHAEMLAIAVAQQAVGNYDLGAEGLPTHELATSSEPCAMCFGAIPWSGVRSVLCAARDEDVRALGFDEGPKLADWAAALEQRDIGVTRDLLRAEAVAVLRRYEEQGGVIYNTRPGS